jgi:hypothetical protein
MNSVGLTIVGILNKKMKSMKNKYCYAIDSDQAGTPILIEEAIAAW